MLSKSVWEAKASVGLLALLLLQEDTSQNPSEVSCESESDAMSATSDANGAVGLDNKEQAFGKMLQNAYRRYA